MKKVLFVCLGNICRSPVAEAVFKKKVAERGLQDKIYADSAGTSNYHIGSGPDPRSRENALLNNVHIDHKARQLVPEDMDYFDYIITMDESNYRNTLSLSTDEQQRDKVFMMRSFTEKGPDPSVIKDVPDPYYGGDEGFQHVFDILDDSCEHLLNYIVKSPRQADE